MNKKREKDILKMVYDNNQIDEIINNENPDFKIKKKSQEKFFGVEVTEFYYSELSARMKNIPKYISDIINNKQYRHKKDRKALEVKTFTLQSDNKPDKQLEGIIQEIPPVTEYVRMVVDIIENKSKRIQDYVKGLNHVNLIILDTENRLILIRRSNFYMMFFTSYLKTALCNTAFREVFFVTKIETDRWVYIPLKMLFLVSELYLFDGILHYYYPHLHLNSPKEKLTLFGQYMNHLGAGDIYIVDIVNEFEVIYGDCGIIVTDDKEIIVRCYTDHVLPKNAQPFYGENTALVIDDTFIKNAMEFAQQNGFETDMVFDAHSTI
jgi:hypothetical protein